MQYASATGAQYNSGYNVGSVLSAVDAVIHAKALPPAAIIPSLRGKLWPPREVSTNPSYPFIILCGGCEDAVFTIRSFFTCHVLPESPEREAASVTTNKRPVNL